MITGAGGSIGSELSRQVSQLACGQLILLEQKLQLYGVERELPKAVTLRLSPFWARS